MGISFRQFLAMHVTEKVVKWASSSDANQDDERIEADLHEDANVVCSRRVDDPWFGSRNLHSVMLDLDVPAWLVPSSTEGHSHLYVAVSAKEEDYFAFLDAAAKIGVITPTYAEVSKKKGGTRLRLPWVKKSEADAKVPEPMPF